jgi:hypothetical protein
MKKTLVYIAFILILFVLMYWLNSQQPVKHIWKPTYDTVDKQPYGAFVLDKMLKASWKKEYTHCYKSISDLKDEGKLDGNNLFIITEEFVTTESDVEKLLEYIQEGGTALIAAGSFGKHLCNRLKIWAKYGFSPANIALKTGMILTYDTLRFCTPGLNSDEYRIPAALCPRFLIGDSLETKRDSVFIVAKSNNQQAIMLRYPIGKGSLLLSCNPLIYTNYGILNDSGNMFLWNSFACLQGKPLIRTEYYHAGSNAHESQSPFRYLMSKPPLKWALIMVIVTILIFMLFTAKRKQKAIPVVKPPQNKMLDFVRSVAGLYLRNNNNADIILKKQIYWAEHLKRNYGTDIINEKHDNQFFERLSSKTGQTVDELTELFRYLDNINKNTYVSDEKMMETITRINSISDKN